MAYASRAQGRGARPNAGRGFGNANQDIRYLPAQDQEMNAHLPERFRGNRSSMPPTSSTSKMDPNKIQLNLEIRNYLQAQNAVVTAHNSEWTSRSEIPTNVEVSLMDDEEVSLPANKIKGPWKSKDRYLRAHYELLREDSVSPLRDAIDKVRLDPDMKDDQTVAIYENAHIAGFTFAPLGIAARIKFSTARAGKAILWQSSKRLVSGSIVALTPAQDKFRTKCVVAIVAARPLAGVEASPPEIDIYFSRPEDIEIDPQQEWLMIEPKQGYYESMRYTMSALQKMSRETFPLADQICSLVRGIEPPAYVQIKPAINLAVVAEDANQKASLQHVDIISNWPHEPSDSLDETQWAAMQHILTKKLAIIQGPPGTGKTHISKIALQVLVANRSPDDPPIIIAAQTNHALDQLLMHVSKFDPDFIRLGGRSTSAEIKQRALYEIRKNERVPQIPGSLLGRSSKQKTLQAQEMQALLEPLVRNNRRVPFSVETLLELGTISKEQAKSLNAGAAQWVTSDNESQDAMFEWVGKSLVPFEVVYKQDSFGFDEVDEDLEFEQLREHEAEHGVADEEDIEILKGIWCSVHDRFSVPKCSAMDLDRAKRQLDTIADLWKIPERQRGPIYAVMQEKAKMAILVKFRDQAKIHEKLVQDVKIGRWERDSIFLSQAKIIGMTTTGLSKYRCLIASLKPKIILIEEAAEVIEAPVTAACVESLEHLILVGDHQQLQGHCSVSELEGEPYYLNVSMFERLVNNNIPFTTLLRQRRMDPEFRRLLAPIYPRLEDHPIVRNRPSLDVGMGSVKSFFLNHNWLELRDGNLSTYNDKEAVFVAGLYRYLLKNGATAPRITILTFYNGQRKRILQHIRKDAAIKELYNDVKTVDSYQGEENDIVILSLVRSNEQNKIGFLEISNRVCVALSRAKMGFYIIGNASLLANQSPLWAEVVRIMGDDRPSKVDTQFPIQCKNHRRVTYMTYPEDWQDNDGGCDQPCRGTLPCGHACTLKCHPYPHERMRCLQRCGKKLNCHHECDRQCPEPCHCDCKDFVSGGGWQDEPDHGEDDSSAGPAPSQPRLNGKKPSANGITSKGSKQRGEVRGNNSTKNKHQGRSYNGPPQYGQYAWSTFPTIQESQAGAPKSAYALPPLPPTLCSPQEMNSLGPSISSGSFTVRSLTYDYGCGGGSQYRQKQQQLGQALWNGFANGGVRTDDKVRAEHGTTAAEASSLNKGVEVEGDLLLDFDEDSKLSSNTSPVQSETLTKLQNGRTRYDQNVQFSRAASYDVPTLQTNLLD